MSVSTRSPPRIFVVKVLGFASEYNVVGVLCRFGLLKSRDDVDVGAMCSIGNSPISTFMVNDIGVEKCCEEYVQRFGGGGIASTYQVLVVGS